jgi:tripartite-type tricarboxylate transporter receptor subunit TctC
MKKSMFFFILLVCVVGMVWGAASKETPTTAKAFPTKPIDVYVGFAAGGGTDVLVRQIVRNMEPVLGTSMPVKNINGAGGLLAINEMMVKPADGYSIAVILGNQFLQKYYQGQESWMDPLVDVSLLGVFNQDPWGIAVHKNAPFDDIQGFIDYAKKNPNVLVGAGSPGTLYYWTWEALMRAADIELTIVPFGGTALSLSALAGNELMAAGASPSEADALMSAGLVKMIGVASETRLKAYSWVPTFLEGGFDMVIGPWRALVGPKGMPAEIIEVLENALKEAYYSENFQNFIDDQGFGPLYLDTKDGYEFFKEENTFFYEIMKESGELRKGM